jgi:hypothetical protein
MFGRNALYFTKIFRQSSFVSASSRLSVPAEGYFSRRSNNTEKIHSIPKLGDEINQVSGSTLVLNGKSVISLLEQSDVFRASTLDTKNAWLEQNSSFATEDSKPAQDSPLATEDSKPAQDSPLATEDNRPAQIKQMANKFRLKCLPVSMTVRGLSTKAEDTENMSTMIGDVKKRLETLSKERIELKIDIVSGQRTAYGFGYYMVAFLALLPPITPVGILMLLAADEDPKKELENTEKQITCLKEILRELEKETSPQTDDQK